VVVVVIMTVTLLLLLLACIQISVCLHSYRREKSRGIKSIKKAIHHLAHRCLSHREKKKGADEGRKYS